MHLTDKAQQNQIILQRPQGSQEMRKAIRKKQKTEETIWISKSQLFAGGERGLGGRADKPRLAKGR